MTVNGLRRGHGRFVGPERIDELVGGDDLVRAHRQHRDEHALLRTTDGNGAERSGHLEVTEDRKLHKTSVRGDAPGRPRDRSPGWVAVSLQPFCYPFATGMGDRDVDPGERSSGGANGRPRGNEVC